MKTIISISTDKKIFETDSSVRQRMIEYGALFKELHIVVFTTQHDALISEQISPNVWVYATSSLHKILYVFDAYVLAKELLRKRKKAIVSTQDPFETGVVGYFLHHKMKNLLHVQIHTDMYSPYFKKGSIFNRIRLWVAPYVCRKAYLIRVVSKRIKLSLMQNLKITDEKIIILPIYVDRPVGIPLRKDDGNTLLSLSRLTHEKNLFFLVDVMGKVVSRVNRVRLVIVGDGPFRKALEAYIEAKQLTEHVYIEGWQQDPEHYFEHATAFVSTSLYEGYGMTFVEAALQRVPIVASDVGIMNDIFKDDESAMICSVNNKDCFVEKICSLLENKEKMRELSERAYSEVSLSIPKTKSEYLEQYKNSICDY